MPPNGRIGPWLSVVVTERLRFASWKILGGLGRVALPGVRGASHAHLGHAGQTACLTSRVQLSDECGDLARHLAGHF